MLHAPRALIVVTSLALSTACGLERPDDRRDGGAIDAGVVRLDGSRPSDGGEDAAGELEDAGFDAGAGEDGGAPDAGELDGGAEPDGGPDGGASDAGADGGPIDGGASDAGAGLPCDPLGPGADPLARYQTILLCLADAAASDPEKEAAIAAFITAVEAEGGFPIVASGQTVFVYVRSPVWDAEDDALPDEDYHPDRRHEPIRVSGDFNGWSPAGIAMTHAGLDFFHAALAQSPGPEDRWRYKLVARDGNNADVWFSDPLSRRFDFDDFGRLSLVRGNGAQGHLEWLRGVHASRLNVSRPIYLYVPPGYEAGTARYPVIYMHDGQNLFHRLQPNSAPATWDVDGVIGLELAAGNIRAPIVVGIPNNANRADEYTHVEDVVNGSLRGGRGEDYAHFVARELKPLIDQRYRTHAGREHTAVLGSSLGGLISYHIGLLYPDVFRYVGGMSSTFRWGQISRTHPTMIELYGQVMDLPGRDQVFYLDSGGGPPSGGCTVSVSGTDNYCVTVRMRDALIAQGVSTFPDEPNAVPLTPADIDIYHWWTLNAAHDESAWNARMHRPLRLFFRP